MVLQIRQPRGLPDVKSQLDLTPFKLRASSKVLARQPYILVHFPWLQSSTQESNTGIFGSASEYALRNVLLWKVSRSFYQKGRKEWAL